MNYVCSDLHGFSLEKFKTLLDKAGFGNSDFLWVLGDTIDRGSQGIDILKWLMANNNTQLILGNHEAMMLDCSFIFEKKTEKTISKLTGSKLVAYATWITNSGQPTLNALSELSDDEIEGILEYLRAAPLYKEIKVNNQKFILTHSGLGSFRKDKKLSEYSKEDLLWNRTEFDQEYFDDAIVVFGHTPTIFFGEKYKGEAVKTKTWIDIDAGAGLGLNPMLLRLEDMKEFYFATDLHLIEKAN